MGDRLVHLLSGREFGGGVELRKQSAVELKEIEPIEPQPLLGKGFRKTRRPRIVEEACRLRLKHLWPQKFASAAQFAQRSVRRRTPEEIGES